MRQTSQLPGNDFCWVYILREGESETTLFIGYSPSLPRMLVSSHGKQLLYYRQFAYPVDGLSHKLFLETLSPESITYFILQYNPTGTNLLEEFDCTDIPDNRLIK